MGPPGTFHTLQRRAAHEAGHIVVALETGWSFEYVTLKQHPQFHNLWGYVQYSRPLQSQDDLPGWAPTFLGGQFGEALLLGFAGPGGSQDNATVMEQLQLYLKSTDAARAAFQQASIQARNIVLQHGDDVRRIAEELCRSETLTQTEVVRLLEEDRT